MVHPQGGAGKCRTDCVHTVPQSTDALASCRHVEDENGRRPNRTASSPGSGSAHIRRSWPRMPAFSGRSVTGPRLRRRCGLTSLGTCCEGDAGSSPYRDGELRVTSPAHAQRLIKGFLRCASVFTRRDGKHGVPRAVRRQRPGLHSRNKDVQRRHLFLGGRTAAVAGGVAGRRLRLGWHRHRSRWHLRRHVRRRRRASASSGLCILNAEPLRGRSPWKAPWSARTSGGTKEGGGPYTFHRRRPGQRLRAACQLPRRELRLRRRQRTRGGLQVRGESAVVTREALGAQSLPPTEPPGAAAEVDRHFAHPG